MLRNGVESSFEDYYDNILNQISDRKYDRRYKLSRGECLNFLKSIGVPTIKYGSYRDILSHSGKVVVYTDNYLHMGLGKHIYDINTARSQYGNSLMAEYIENTGGYTIKYLQVGERRFNLLFYNGQYKESLTEGILVKAEELPSQYNIMIRRPIYSIDYISNGITMVAVDFNEVQPLKRIGFENIMKAEDVAMEVNKALIKYNIL